MGDLSRHLLEAATTAEALPAWRLRALELLRRRLPFDAALFHELSPRVPLDRGAFMGLDPAVLVAGMGAWDAHAVRLGRLRDLAMAQGGAVTDAEAFRPGTPGAAAWQALVGGPLGLTSSLIGHLVVRRRVVSVVLLGRRSEPGFAVKERRALVRLLPALAVADALLQATETGALRGMVTEVACVDQRLTPRQRQVVEQVAMGRTNREIGVALGISENTVRNLLVGVRARLHAANRAEVVRLAVLR